MSYSDSTDFEEKNHEKLSERFIDKYSEEYDIFVEEQFAQDGIDEDALYEQTKLDEIENESKKG
jgi:hypothetical protein